MQVKKKSVRLLVLFTLLLLSACGCQRKKDEQANRLVKDLKANAWVIEGTDSTDDPKMRPLPFLTVKLVLT